MLQHAKRLTYPALWLALVLTVVAVRDAQAHKAVTSRYTYNNEIFPILRDRCGSCHVTGGVAPMSLLTFKDANSWAESIREELQTGQMPPWHVDPLSPPVRGAHPITPRELDMVVTWASGGTPQGDLDKKPALPVWRPQWRLGPPDLKVPMETEHTVDADKAEDDCDEVLSTGLTETKWVKGADLLPGTPAMVRSAIIGVENGPVLSVWEPGADGGTAPSGAAFKLAAGAKLVLHLHYKKGWEDTSKKMTDKSTVGLYFTDPPAPGHEIQAFPVDAPASPTSSASTLQARTFGASLTGAARVVALRPSLDQPYALLDVHAVTPSGGHVPLLLLRAPRPEWRRRYWLQDPIELPSGSTIEVTATPEPPDPDARTSTEHDPLQVALDFVRP